MSFSRCAIPFNLIFHLAVNLMVGENIGETNFFTKPCELEGEEGYLYVPGTVGIIEK